MQVEKTPNITTDGANSPPSSGGGWGPGAAAPVKPAPKRKPPVALIAVVAIGLGVGAVFGTRWYQHSVAFVSTDDAQIAGNLVTVSPKVPGEIAQILVDEGASVTKGEVIAKLDDEDFKAQLAQAEAGLAVARSGLSPSQVGVSLQTDQIDTQLSQAESALRAARAGLQAAQANASRAASDLQRVTRLYQGGGASKQQLDAMRTGRIAADSQVTGAVSQVANAEAMVRMAHAGTQAVELKSLGVDMSKARIAQAMAAVDMAQLEVEHTTLTSPVDGVVARRMSNVGEHVMPGQGLFAITQSGAVWIEAMVEETDIARVHLGAPVDVTVDSYPGQDFKGHVTMIGSVTGAQFSLLPENNAQGNYTKVVQRIPVRIEFNQPSDLLRPGMSVEVDIAARGK